MDEEPVGEGQSARWLLAHMLEYFRREAKCVWWEFFRMHDLEVDDLLRERKAVAGLRFSHAVPGQGGRLPTHRYTFRSQEVTLDEGSDLIEVSGERIGKVAAIDHLNRTLDIRKRGDSVDIHPAAVFRFQTHPTVCFAEISTRVWWPVTRKPTTVGAL